MKQLSGLDAAFIHQESPRTPMHVSPVLLYGPAPGGGQCLDLAMIEQVFRRALPSCSILTQKLVSLPMGVDEPYWVIDDEFDLHRHIDTIALPAPATWQQLKTLLASFHSQGLNMGRPLWHARLITGLDHLEDMPPGSVALLLKVHHAAIDGVSLARLVATLHDSLAEDAGTGTTPGQGRYDPLEMWGRANVKNWTRPIKLMTTVSRLIPAVSKLRTVKKPAELTSKTRLRKTRFNRAVTRGRAVGALHMPLADLKSIKYGVRRVTLNDIAMSIVGGALREYLQAHGELPRDSLVCGAPINLRSRDDASGGNKIATMQVGLATDIEDPIERTRAVHQYAVMGKSRINTLGTGTIMDISDSVAPALLAEGLRALSFASTRVNEMPVPFHVMISNIPGPATAITMGGAPLIALLGLGPIRHSMGLFHIVSNCADLYSISFTSCRSILPDADFYEQCLAHSFQKMLTTVRAG